MKTVKKIKGKSVNAYRLGADSEVVNGLIEKGFIRQESDTTWRIMSQESTSGELAVNGDYIKIDSSGRPYPNKREYFLKNHKSLGADEFEQIPNPLKAWDIEEPMCKEVEFLLEHKGLSIDKENEKSYYSAPLWGDMETAAKDAVIVFYDICYDGDTVTDVDFNFVARNEFDKSYEVMGQRVENDK